MAQQRVPAEPRNRDEVASLLTFFVSPWFLVCFLVAGLAYWLLLPSLVLGLSYSDAFFLALGVMTGGDPYQLTGTLYVSGTAWLGAWILHVVSWLIIPVLAGMVFADMERRLHLQRVRQVQDQVREALAALGWEPDDQNEVADTVPKDLR